MGDTSIEWADKVWNPLTGCTRVTSGCDHCYAFTLHDMRHKFYQEHDGFMPDGRRMPVQYAKPFTEIQLIPDRLQDPLKNKKPTKYFVNSMSDLFHSKVPEDYIRQVFDVMRQADWHIFQVLTKRSGRLRHLGPRLNWPDNVWMGVSIENDALTVRADALRVIPAQVRFLSCEPLLGPLPSLNLEGIDWVIVGGESGREARRMSRDWVAGVRDKCVDAEVPFFFKQWGGHTPKAGGRMLDGREWNEFPV